MSCIIEGLRCFFRGLGLMFWPIISAILGIPLGILMGVLTTILVFVITLVRTPMHIAKMMYVTATTQECFERCSYFDPFLRVAVFLLVPIPHLLWLGGVTVFSLTCGTLYYISKATKMLFLHEYVKTFSKVKSNAKLEKESHLGSYIKGCQEYMERDEESYPAIYALKGICALVPGVPLGVLPFIPFSIMVLLITIYRLPINFYKTMKIALFTVVLKWDLKLAALFTLPIAHTVFPLVVFVTALIGSFFFFVYATTSCIARGKSPFEKWYKFKTELQKYYRAHQQFVGKNYCDRFDHPTGIPSGWQGESYGIPIQRLLKWQWDFLVCCFLLLVGFPICLVGTSIIFAVKLVPGTVSWSRLLCQNMLEKSTVEILGCWTFYLLGFVLVPVGAALVSILAVVIGTMMSFGIPWTYLSEGYVAGFCAPFEILEDADSWDFFELGDFRIFPCSECLQAWQRQHGADGEAHSNNRTTQEERRKFSAAYWDRFASQCIRSTSDLLAKNWISLEDVQCMESSLIQAIPAVAVLQILADTVVDTNAKKDDILWKIDGTLCEGKDRPTLDNLAAFLWPKIAEAKRLLSAKEKKKLVLAETENVEALAAMLCTNTDETTDTLATFVKDKKIGENSQAHSAANRRVRAKLTEISLAILRMKPFQDRMTAIFEYGYVESGLEKTVDNDKAAPFSKNDSTGTEDLERQ